MKHFVIVYSKEEEAPIHLINGDIYDPEKKKKSLHKTDQ